MLSNERRLYMSASLMLAAVLLYIIHNDTLAIMNMLAAIWLKLE